jgi:hypothetical protein
MGFVSFMVKFVILLISLHPGTCFSLVILRSPANRGTTKNLEILRGVYPESAEGLRMTGWSVLRGGQPE